MGLISWDSQEQFCGSPPEVYNMFVIQDNYIKII